MRLFHKSSHIKINLVLFCLFGYTAIGLQQKLLFSSIKLRYSGLFQNYSVTVVGSAYAFSGQWLNQNQNHKIQEIKTDLTF